MAKYHYIARDNDGRRIEGIIEASSDIAVISRLRTQNLFPVEVFEVTKKYIQSKKEKKIFFKKVNLKELAIFTRQMSVMLSSGVPIIETLDDLSSQTTNKYFSSVLQSIRKSISQGSSFSQALSQFPKIFSPLYVALVRSGEESGNLAETLGEIAKNLEDQLEMISKTKQALSYPAFVFFFFIVVVSFVFLFLIPRFQKIFESFGAKLPTFTIIILKISNTLVRFLPFVLLLILLLVILFFLFKRTEKGKYIIDSIKLKSPVFGNIMWKIALARYARTLSTLLSGGVPIVSALEIASKTAGNCIIEKAIQKVKNGVVKGGLVGEEMRKYKIFPVMLSRMVSVGEETGKTEDMLNRASQFFKDEVDATLNILSSILEPILIIVLGFIVGTVVLAIYLPIFKLAGAMR